MSSRARFDLESLILGQAVPESISQKCEGREQHRPCGPLSGTASPKIFMLMGMLGVVGSATMQEQFTVVLEHVQRKVTPRMEDAELVQCRANGGGPF